MIARSNSGISVNIPAYHTGQELVLQDHKQFNFIAAGRGWGKTSMAARMLCEYSGTAERKPSMYTDFCMGAIECTIKEVFRRIFGDRFDDFYNPTDMILQPTGWGPIYFRSLDDPCQTRGMCSGLIVNDNAGETEDGYFEKILMPIAFKCSGEVWQFGTPSASNTLNDFYEHCTTSYKDLTYSAIIPVVGSKVIGNRLVRCPDPYECPRYDFEYMEKSWQMATISGKRRIWRNEMLCEFIERL